MTNKALLTFLKKIKGCEACVQAPKVTVQYAAKLKDGKPITEQINLCAKDWIRLSETSICWSSTTP